MISGLERSLPTIQTFVDQNYYSCYNANNLQTNKNGTAIIYIVGAIDFQNYI